MSDNNRRDVPPLGPPVIEALPDLAWARVERAVLAELDTPETRRVHMTGRRWGTVAAIGGAVAAAAVVAVVIAGGDPAPAAQPPASLASRVVTGDAPTDVSYGDAHVMVAPGSALVLDGTAARGVLAVLERGTATFVVEPRHARPPFMVQAGAVAVRVVGTDFSVTRTGVEDATVEVREGVVEVIHHGRRAEVVAPARWSSVMVAASAATAATTVATAEPPSSAAAEPTAAKAPDDPAVTMMLPERRDRARPTPTRPTRTPTPDDGSPTLTPQQQFEAAAALERTDPRAAMKQYRALARGRGGWAGNALYAMGRLAHDRGERDAARDALTAYLHRFPRGGNVADARALLANLQGTSP